MNGTSDLKYDLIVGRKNIMTVLQRSDWKSVMRLKDDGLCIIKPIDDKQKGRWMTKRVWIDEYFESKKRAASERGKG